MSQSEKLSEELIAYEEHLDKLRSYHVHLCTEQSGLYGKKESQHKRDSMFVFEAKKELALDAIRKTEEKITELSTSNETSLRERAKKEYDEELRHHRSA